MTVENNYLIIYHRYKPNGDYQGSYCANGYFTSEGDAVFYLGQEGTQSLLDKKRYQQEFGYRPLKLLKSDPAQYIAFNQEDQTTTTASIVPV